MLALTLRPKSIEDTVYLTIGNIEVQVVLAQVGGGKARLAFVAPPEVTIDRAKVRERKQRNHGRAGAEVTMGGTDATPGLELR